MNKGAQDTENQKANLIAEIYEVALKPERYDHFMALWEAHVARRVDEIERSGNASIEDPELESHFRRAQAILERMGREDATMRTPDKYVEAHGEAAIMLAADGAIVSANTPARELIGPTTGVSGLSTLIDEQDFDRLKAMLLQLDRPHAEDQLSVIQLSLPATSGSNRARRELFILRPVRFERHGPALLFFGALKAAWHDAIDDLLARQFELTPSEIEVARRLAGGQSLAEIAEKRGRSIHTLRAQLKSVLQKTETSTQGDLIRVVTMLSMLGSSGRFELERMRLLIDTGVELTVRLSDGRDMPVRCVGPEDGRPVLFIHGMLDGIAVSKTVSGILRERNIRLIAPIRPHFGASPPAHSITEAPERFADDLAEIMRKLDIRRAPLIGHMAGSVYAFAAAARQERAISGLLIVAGGVPIVSTRQFAAMTPRQRVVAWTARFAPGLLPAIVRAGIAQIDRGDVTDFMNSLYPPGSADRQLVENAEIRTAIYEGYRFAVAQGHRAFQVDSRHVIRDWSDYAQAAVQPVTIVHGAHDGVVTIDSVRDFSRRHNNIRLIVEDDAGQLVFYQKPEVVIDALEDMLETDGRQADVAAN